MCDASIKTDYHFKPFTAPRLRQIAALPESGPQSRFRLTPSSARRGFVAVAAD
jgi:hypothetical protein